MEVIATLECVNDVFFEKFIDKKREYIEQNNADILAMGNDWEGKLDKFNDICRAVYFERPPAISTTEVIEKIGCNMHL